jgi:hypothetical protein
MLQKQSEYEEQIEILGQKISQLEKVIFKYRDHSNILNYSKSRVFNPRSKFLS